MIVNHVGILRLYGGVFAIRDEVTVPRTLLMITADEIERLREEVGSLKALNQEAAEAIDVLLEKLGEEKTMSRALIKINNPKERERAFRLLERVPFGTRVEFKESKRSLPQNARMWVMLTDIAQQLVWYGKKLNTDEWKRVLIDAYWRSKQREWDQKGLEGRRSIVPNTDGTGFVDLGSSTSDLSKEEMGEFMELIAAFGAEHSVKFAVDGEVE